MFTAHVVREAYSGLELRFDGDYSSTGHLWSGGTLYRASDAIVSAPRTSALDYAFLEVPGAPGAQRRGGMKGAPPRGWLSLGEAASTQEGEAIYVLHHSYNNPMTLSTGIIHGADDHDPVYLDHDAATSAGSSGSPCFDADLRLFGIVIGHRVAGGDRWPMNRLLTVNAILSHLRENGHEELYRTLTR